MSGTEKVGMSVPFSGARPARRSLFGWINVSPSSRRVVLVGLCLMIVAVAALSLMIWQLRRDALSEARQNVSTLGLAISEQTARSIQGGQLVLEDLQRQIAQRQPNTVEDFQALLSNRTVFNFLKDRADFLPQVDAFTIIDGNGKLVNFSRQWPIPPTDLADRDYVAYFKTHDTADAFISAPVQNRGTGVWTTYLVRRVNAPSGEFIGMVLAAIDLDYFRDFFKALTEQAGTTVTLLRRDGKVLTSYPGTAKVGDVLPSASHWYDIVGQGRTEVFETQGVLAPGMRLTSVHPLRDYPLVINVSLSKAAVLADWTRISVVTGLCTLLAAICVVLLIRAQIRQFGKLERSERLLGHRNEALEATEQTLLQQTSELSAGRTQLAEQSATLQAALRHMNQGILMVGADGQVAVCNERAIAMLDLPPDLMATHPSFDELIAYQEANQEFVDPSSKIRAGSFERAVTGLRHYERTRPNGTVIEVQTVVMQEGGLVRTYTDVTERRRSEQQVQFLAHHDLLTGLYNRTAFHEKIDALIAQAAALEQRMAIYYIDLDGFKLVNDTYGHAVGDQLLAGVATRLKAAVREMDVIARMGGDEFAIIQPFDGPGANVAELAGRMLLSVAQPFRFGDVRCAVGVSIGVAIYPEHATDPAELLHRADTALYRAKSSGKRMFCIFDSALDHRQPDAASLEQDIARAQERGELHLAYQPIVDAETLEVVRFEALLRWTHPTRGEVSPAEFVPIAERSGLIVPIGRWVLETACEAARSWPGEVEVSVNLSPLQFASGDLAQHVEQCLLRTGLPARQLNLEITEGVLLENTAVVLDTMTRLRDLGIRFSLDDFGTAHAGLTYLRRFPFDVLKIDKSFIQAASQSEQGRNMLGAIQAVGAACELQVVAEGVETPEDLAIVRDLRCDHVQGYLTGRPSLVARVDNPASLSVLRQARLAQANRA